MRTAIVDADSLVYMAARAHEEAIQWEGDLWTLHAHLEPAIVQLNDSVRRIKDGLEADEVVMTLSDYNDPWRKKILPTYKANRKDVRKPLTFKPLREYVHEAFKTYQRPGLEGDDIIGVLLTSDAIVKGDKVAVSLDKDMRTLPGLHLNMTAALEKSQWTPFVVTDSEADYFHLKQSLMGDTTDGYSGCPGVGPVSAVKVLEPFIGEDAMDMAGAWKAIVKQYEKKGLTEEVALQNARVARICRHTDYDFKNKEVRLWQPPK